MIETTIPITEIKRLNIGIDEALMICLPSEYGDLSDEDFAIIKSDIITRFKEVGITRVLVIRPGISCYAIKQE